MQYSVVNRLVSKQDAQSKLLKALFYILESTTKNNPSTRLALIERRMC